MSHSDEPYIYQNPHGPLARAWWLRWLIILGIWALLGLIYAGPIFIEVRSEGMNHAASRVFSWGILTWCAWAPLTPIMIWLARRYSLIGSTWKRSALIHLPAFLILSAVHSAAATVITLQVQPFDNMGASSLDFWPRFLSRMKGAFASDLLVYGAVIGVCYAFDYYRKYRERESLASQLEAQLAQAQLDSLRTQLHPHFLFNTLNGIVGLVRDSKNEAAVTMLVGLSDLLRRALDHSTQQEVELREEINFLELYLNLQQMRFSDRMQVMIDIDPSTARALVPSLILQPLVENALRHGIGRSVGSGVVGISSRAENGSLKLSVFDNGAGLPEKWQLQSGSGIGLTNTAARLKQLYSEHHRFDISNRDGGGVEVIVVIPLKTRATFAAGAS
ncbi:MAG TPA: histidine kinase [Pyrinomonadaceae bacterium]|nr:histidine kinase [Pyrinomonadaceae bacterium]